MNNYNNEIPNPKDSNVYNKSSVDVYSTPLGSHLLSSLAFYKYVIPLGLEKKIEDNLKGLKYE